MASSLHPLIVVCTPMNVRQAFQFTKILQLGSWLLVIAIPSVGIQMTVDVAMGNPHLKNWENQIQPPEISSTTPQLGNTFGIVAKPKPWQRIHLESEDAPPSTDDNTGSVLSETNTVIQEDELLLRCGLHEGDQVIAIEKQPVANVMELTKAVTAVKKEFLLLTITRQGQPLLLLLPTLTVKQLLRLGNTKPH